MANPFNLPELTLNQLGDSTNAINVVGAAPGRLSVYQPLVAIVTDAEGAGDLTAASWPDGAGTEVSPRMEAYLEANAPVFMSKRHGEPWTRGSNKDVGLKHILHQAAATPNVPATTTVLFPNFDYSTFE